MTRQIKSSLVVLMMMLCCAAASAQSFMTFYDTAAKARESWSLLDVGKVTFEGGDIVVTCATGTHSVPITDVLSIKFTDEDLTPTTIKNVTSDINPVRIASSESTVRIIGASKGSVAIWSVSGQQLYDNRDWRGEEINISHLERGIYIITINNSTFKFKK